MSVSTVRYRRIACVGSFRAGDRLFFDTGIRRHEMNGPLAETLLEPAWEHLTQAHSVEELQQHFPGVGAEHIETVLETLVTLGLVEDSTTAFPASTDPAASYFQLMLTDRKGELREDRIKRVRHARIHILHQNLEAEATTLQTMLSDSQIGEKITVADWGTVTPEHPAFTQDLKICLLREAPVRLTEASINLLQRLTGTYLLASRCFLRNEAYIGPRAYTPLGEKLAAIAPWPESMDKGDQTHIVLSERLWLSRLSLEVFYALTESPKALPPSAVKRFSLATGDVEERLLIRESKLKAACGLLENCGEDERNAFLTLEEHIVAQADGGTLPRSSALSSHFPEPQDPTSMYEYVQLPEETDFDTRASELTLGTLASLLQLTAGVRSIEDEERIKRWCPSAGNLGSVDINILISGVEGVAPGAYRYASERHALQRIAYWNEVAEPFPEAGHEPYCYVLVTGVPARLVSKYAEFSYRLLFFDAGAAFAQLFESIQRTAIPYSSPDRIALSEIRSTFALHPLVAIPLYGIELGAPPDKLLFKSARASELSILLGDVRQSTRYPEGPLGPLLTSLIWTPSASPRPAGGVRRKTEQWLKTAFRFRAQRAIKSIAAQRSACTVFAPVAVRLAVLLEIVAYAFDQLESIPGRISNADDDIAVRVMANRVDGLGKGVYAYRKQGTPGLKQIRLLTDTFWKNDLFIGEVHEPAAIIWIHRKDTGTPLNHRNLFLKAGAVANFLWLKALEYGLDGCIIAGIKRDISSRILDLSPYAELSCLAFVLGTRAEEE